jgi:hypothetical protein
MTNLALTYPQVAQAACGSFGLPQVGQATRFTGFNAWWARRVRVRIFDIFFTGSMFHPFLEARFSSAIRSSLIGS